MLTAYSRVTVMTAERKVDIALPSALPMADVVPQVLRYCAPDSSDGQLTSWTLARLGGQPLALTQTLTDAGVLDGDVLELRAQRGDVRPAMVEDVRDSVEDNADAAGGAWASRTTVTFVLVTGAALLSVIAAIVLVRPGLLDAEGAPLLVSVVAATLVLIAMAAWAAYFAHEWVSQICTAVAMVWGLLTGFAFGDEIGLDPAVTLIIAVSLVTLVAGSVRLITPAAMGHLAAAVVLLVAGLADAIGDLSSIQLAQVHRVLPVAGLLASGVIPRLSLSVGGLASADYRVRHVGRMSTKTLRARYRQSNAILIGGLVATSMVVLWSTYQLTTSTNPWDRYLALSVGVAAVLRSRVYSRIQHMVAFRAVGIAIVALQLVRLSDDVRQLRAWLILIMIGSIILAVGISTLRMSQITRARVKRVLNIVEFLVIVDVIVLMGGALGVFSLLGGII